MFLLQSCFFFSFAFCVYVGKYLITDLPKLTVKCEYKINDDSKSS